MYCEGHYCLPQNLFHSKQMYNQTIWTRRVQLDTGGTPSVRSCFLSLTHTPASKAINQLCVLFPGLNATHHIQRYIKIN